VVNYVCHSGHQNKVNFMRRFVSHTGIFLLTVLIGGWGNVVAAALCPHAGMSQPQAMAEDHSCCRAKIQSAGTHHSAQHHQAGHGAKTKPIVASHLHDHDAAAAALGPVAGECGHCVGQSESPAAASSVRELTLPKRAAVRVAEHTATPPAPIVALSISHFFPSQHAPPERTRRKHLLLSIFLI
jgi:hypothetical protein